MMCHAFSLTLLLCGSGVSAFYLPNPWAYLPPQNDHRPRSVKKAPAPSQPTMDKKPPANLPPLTNVDLSPVKKARTASQPTMDEESPASLPPQGRLKNTPMASGSTMDKKSPDTCENFPRKSCGPGRSVIPHSFKFNCSSNPEDGKCTDAYCCEDDNCFNSRWGSCDEGRTLNRNSTELKCADDSRGCTDAYCCRKARAETSSAITSSESTNSTSANKDPGNDATLSSKEKSTESRPTLVPTQDAKDMPVPGKTAIVASEEKLTESISILRKPEEGSDSSEEKKANSNEDAGLDAYAGLFYVGAALLVVIAVFMLACGVYYWRQDKNERTPSPSPSLSHVTMGSMRMISTSEV